jgi:hypothetical protein
MRYGEMERDEAYAGSRSNLLIDRNHGTVYKSLLVHPNAPRRRRHHMHPNTKLVLVMEGEILETTWGSFIQDNDLNEEPAWKAQIEADLNKHGSYHGGGGAQPWFKLMSEDKR